MARYKVFFNASVILAGLKSSSGGSAKLLNWSKEKKIIGIVSEVILNEVERSAWKIGLDRQKAERKIMAIFPVIISAPKPEAVAAWAKTVVDYGDSHILASCQETKADFLATLDKKHLLVLQTKIKSPKIVSPKQLIEALS